MPVIVATEIAEGVEDGLSTAEISCNVADDLIDYIADYCAIEKPAHKTHRGAAWREASGRFRGVNIRLSTAARRYLGAA